MRKNKKAELTTQQIVILIVAVVSFAVILFLLFRLNLSETSDEQICHNSVVLKSQEKIPLGDLDCNTKYICISGGGKCENFDSAKTVEIDLREEDAREKIMKAIADEMVSCWWMFGEGELKYGGDRDCALCSVVMFDDKILSEVQEDETFNLAYRDFYTYLNSIEKDASRTYFNYLYNAYDVDVFQENVANLRIDLDNDFLVGEGRYNIVTGIYSLGIGSGNAFLSVYYAASGDISSKLEPKCNKFVTKA